MNFQSERLMVDRKSNKFQFVGGVIVLLCGILMVVLQLVDWAMFGEKLQLGVAVVLMCMGTVLMAVGHHRKGAK
jgi:uncharacterized membrane protein